MPNLTRKQFEDSIKCGKNQIACYDCSCEGEEGNCLFSDNIGQTALTFLDMLKRLEFVGGYCQICSKYHGHYEDCDLGNLLKEVQG